MAPTISSSYWLDWFEDTTCSSHNTTPSVVSSPHQHNTRQSPLSSQSKSTLSKRSSNYTIESSRSTSTSSAITPRRLFTPGDTRSNKHNRRTYQPGARRVLKKEHLRFINASSTKRRFSARQVFLRRRHSASSTLLSFVHSGQTASLPPSSFSPTHGTSLRNAGHPFFASFHSTSSPWPNPNPNESVPAVRSSMVLESIHPPDSVYTGTICSRSWTDKRSWFSHWILHHPRTRPPLTNDTRSPLIRQATVSDLSTLADSYHPQPSTLSSFYFSATWKSHTGKSGTRVLHVDESGRLEKGSWWDSCDHERSVHILAGLFLTGFLACPFWWVGAALYLSRSDAFNADLHVVHLWTPRTLGHLNCWMAATSLVLMGAVAGVFILYRLPS